jgi:hypothetical protein
MDFPEGVDRTPPGNPYSFGGFLIHVLKIARSPIYTLSILKQLAKRTIIHQKGRIGNA